MAVPGRSRAGAWVSLATIAVVTLASLVPILPDPVAASAAPDVFSSARARQHLTHIAAAPHPVRSAEHARVHAYLLQTLRDLDLETEAWDTPLSLDDGALPLRNLLARLPGTQATRKPVLLLAHYDSAPRAPGAGDDGAAVAAMLETLRALKTGAPLAADVLALLTDGEEMGLLGARQCVRDARLANVGVVLNFEARGNRGASLMFESSTANLELIEAFARAAPVPTASSLMGEVYRQMPNDTDFTIFRDAGFHGLNFAFIGGYDAYHESWDSIDNLDERSLQHHGEQMLALARHFASHEVTLHSARGDAVYFNFGPWFVHYPAALVWPFTIGAVVLLLIALVRMRGELEWAALGAGLVTILGTIGLVAILGFALAQALLLMPAKPTRWFPWGHTRHDSEIFVLLVIVALLITCAALRRARKKVPATCVLAATLCVWVAALVATSYWLPGATYLFLAPIALVMVTLCVSSRARPIGRAIHVLALTPALIVIAPFTSLLMQGMMLGLAAVALPFVVLTLALAWPLVAE